MYMNLFFATITRYLRGGDLSPFKGEHHVIHAIFNDSNTVRTVCKPVRAHVKYVYTQETRIIFII